MGQCVNAFNFRSPAHPLFLIFEASFSTASRISFGSDILPSAIAPLARRPFVGPIKLNPISRARSTLRCTAGLCHILPFIAGAKSVGFCQQTQKVALSRSSQIPFVIFAMILAVAGARTTISAQSTRFTCLILYSSDLVHKLVKTGEPVTASKLFGPTNRQAFSVITVLTPAPAAVSLLARSTALYAAIPPLTPSRTLSPSSRIEWRVETFFSRLWSGVKSESFGFSRFVSLLFFVLLSPSFHLSGLVPSRPAIYRLQRVPRW